MDRRKRYRQTVALMSMLSETKTIDNVDIATFDGNGENLLSLIVGIDPMQDLHGYDSPWPGGGGKNLFNPVTALSASYYAVNNDESVTVLSNDPRAWSEMPAFDLKAGDYYIKVFGSSAKAQMRTSEDGYTNNIYIVPDMGRAFSLSVDGGIKLKPIVGISDFPQTVYIAIVSGAIAPTSWSPYSNICPISGWTACNISHSGADTSDPTIYTIAFPSEAGTVYGGTLDVVRKKLTVDKAIVTFDGTQSNFSVTALSDYSQVGWSGYINVGVANDVFVSDTFQTGAVGRGGLYKVYPTVVPRMFFGLPKSITTSDEAKAWFEDNPTSVVYHLATPIVYDLADVPTIQTFAGENNIWADTGKIIFLEYEV